MNRHTVLLALMSLNIGGAETHVVELARQLKKNNYNVIVASNGGVFVQVLEQDNITHIKVPLHNKNPINIIKSFFMLRQIIRREKVELVHAHARIPGFICGKLKKIEGGFNFVTTAHWVFSTKFGLKYITDWGQKTLAVSGDIKKYLIDSYNLPPQNIFVTINGIDTEKFSPDIKWDDIKREFALTDSEHRIIYCSRMDKDRSLAAFHLIEAGAELLKDYNDLEIVIVGEGDHFEQLEQDIQNINQKAGKEFIKPVGGRVDVNKFIAAGQLFIGVSRAALEAMSCQKGVIVAGNEGYIGLFNQDKLDACIATNFTCRSSPPSSAQRIKNDIEKFFNMNPQQQKQLQIFGREIVKKSYSVEKMAQDNMDVYRLVGKDK